MDDERARHALEVFRDEVKLDWADSDAIAACDDLRRQLGSLARFLGYDAEEQGGALHIGVGRTERRRAVRVAYDAEEGLYVRPEEGKPVAVELLFSRKEKRLYSLEADPAIAPTPGEPLPTKSPLQVLAETVVAVMRAHD
ncbi:MAG: hypothetical protein VYE22_41070 [Myxococcota bacterium]|nr:hypothetical protein [Myxococcota bacterium]